VEVAKEFRSTKNDEIVRTPRARLTSADQVDFNGAVSHVRQVKNGTPSTHPIQGVELRALRRLHRESPTSPFVVSESGSPFTTAGLFPPKPLEPTPRDRRI
jgi:hypothetical protein